MKYGFVYIWRDRKHKRFYIGSRWGSIDDGYVCSSVWMKNAYKRRPHDFSRRILATNLPREILIETEQRWLNLIQPEEVGKKYYNLNKYAVKHWHVDPETRLTIGQKISASPNRAANIGKANRGRQFSDLAKQRQREVMVGRTQSEEEKERRAVKLRGRKWTWKNLGKTKGMITVVTRDGITLRINTIEYNNQTKGPDMEYATVRSDEGKRRKGSIK